MLTELKRRGGYSGKKRFLNDNDTFYNIFHYIIQEYIEFTTASANIGLGKWIPQRESFPGIISYQCICIFQMG